MRLERPDSLSCAAVGRLTIPAEPVGVWALAGETMTMGAVAASHGFVGAGAVCSASASVLSGSSCAARISGCGVRGAVGSRLNSCILALRLVSSVWVIAVDVRWVRDGLVGAGHGRSAVCVGGEDPRTIALGLRARTQL